MAKDVRVKQRGPAYPNFPELLAHPHQSGGREGRAVPELTGDYCTVQSRLDVRWLHRQHGPAGPNAAKEGGTQLDSRYGGTSQEDATGCDVIR